MRRYLKLFVAALLAVTMAIFVAACDGGAGDDEKNATSVSGKTYVYVDGSVSGTDQMTGEALDAMYGGKTVTFMADGTVESDVFFDATWTQNGASVTLTMDMGGGMNLTYNCKATGNAFTVTATNGSAKMTLNFKLVTPEGGDENDDNGNNDGDDEEEGESGVSGKAYVFADVTLVSNTGSYPAYVVNEIIASGKQNLGGTHFVFLKGGTFLAVKGDDVMTGTWTQSGNSVTAVMEGEPETFTLNGNEIAYNMSEDGLTLKIAYTYDKDYTYDGEIPDDEGGSSTVTSKGRAYSFKSVTVEKNTSPISDAELIAGMEKSAQDSHFIFNENGTFTAVSGKTAVEGTWSRKGDILIAEIDGAPQEFTVSGDDIYAIVYDLESEGIILKMTYTFDGGYTYDGPVSGGGNADVNDESTKTINVTGLYELYDIVEFSGGVDDAQAVREAILAEYGKTAYNFTYCDRGYGGGEYVGGERDGMEFKFYVDGDNGSFSVYVDEAVFTYAGDLLLLEDLYSEEYGVSFSLAYRIAK